MSWWAIFFSEFLLVPFPPPCWLCCKDVIRRFLHQDERIANGHIHHEPPEELLPPFSSFSGNAVSWSQLVSSVHPIHILCVQFPDFWACYIDDSPILLLSLNLISSGLEFVESSVTVHLSCQAVATLASFCRCAICTCIFRLHLETAWGSHFLLCNMRRFCCPTPHGKDQLMLSNCRNRCGDTFPIYFLLGL